MMGVRETCHRDDPPSRKKEKKIGNPRWHGHERDKRKMNRWPGRAAMLQWRSCALATHEYIENKTGIERLLILGLV
jgi:hypothetical protein